MFFSLNKNICSSITEIWTLPLGREHGSIQQHTNTFKRTNTQDVFALARALTAGYICFSLFPSGSCNCQFNVFSWLMCLKSELDDWFQGLPRMQSAIQSLVSAWWMLFQQTACGIGYLIWIFYIVKRTDIKKICPAFSTVFTTKDNKSK